MPESNRWPALRVDEWTATRDTLHLYSQVVGKVRLANDPIWNQWWNATLYLTASGLTTSLLPHATGPAFQIDFDFHHHVLAASTVDGTSRTIDLTQELPVSAFHTQLLDALDELGVETRIWPMPVEIPDAVSFDDDLAHAAYDPDAVQRFFRSLCAIDQVFKWFRSQFTGKSTPVHLFWGAFDLATTRFSGRPAPPHPGGAPNCGHHVMHEAYSQEVSSSGFWPGSPGEEGTFYSYAYPEPPGIREYPIEPEAARWDEELAEFVLPYEAVRTASDPEATLLRFLQTTYEAAANTGSWNRDPLERDGDLPGAHLFQIARPTHTS